MQQLEKEDGELDKEDGRAEAETAVSALVFLCPEGRAATFLDRRSSEDQKSSEAEAI